jgi:dihydroorotate dehydrogenase (fumarate)
MNLATTYLGMNLPHPFMAGAGPFAEAQDGAQKLEDAGAAAIVLPSLFEEEVDAESIATHQATEGHAHSHGEAASYFAEPEEFVIGPDAYLELIQRTHDAVDIPVIASLNGYTRGGWLKYARYIEEAGASALELNLYVVANDVHESADMIEDQSADMIRELKSVLKIPVAVKLSPFYTSLAHFAKRMEDAGVDGIILFNRFFEADIDIEELEQKSRLHLSSSEELLLRLRWLAILSGTLGTASMAVSGGVHTPEDAIKATMAGASAIQMVSSLFREGLGHLEEVKRGMVEWMEEKEYQSISQMRGSMNIESCPDPKALSRANYMHQLRTWREGSI